MTQLAWDQLGERSYEIGLDRGVLYTDDGIAVVWNGLTSVSEDNSAVAVSSYYLDGVKYLAVRSPNDFSGTLKAITYPDEFLPYDGYLKDDVGITVSDQLVAESFGLSYRTRVGTDDDPEAGYRIHLLYNLTAKPDSKENATTGSQPKPIEFSWVLSGIPVLRNGFRPAVHIYIDSRDVEDYQLAAVENYLYGTDDNDPALPMPDDLAEIILSADPSTIVFDGGGVTPVIDETELIFDGGRP